MSSPIVVTPLSKKLSGFTGHGIRWGAARPRERGPVIPSLSHPAQRNAIGTHSGAQAVYRALATATGLPTRERLPLPERQEPALQIGPHPQWFNPQRIVSFDPWGHQVASAFAEEIAAGADIRPTIAVLRTHIHMPEVARAVAAGRLIPDGQLVTDSGDVRVTKVAIEPVWWLPGVALRFGLKESTLRRALFEQTAGMFPELITRPDLKVFLPPIGGMTLYLFGDLARLGQAETRIACRLHDECNGSDVFGAGLCTCRPHLVHGIQVCLETAQQGGVGVVVYRHQERRGLAEASSGLADTARSRLSEGEWIDTDLERPECVAGMHDSGFHDLLPDVFHWLGIRRIDCLVSTSRRKQEALTAQGIEVAERLSISDPRLPPGLQGERDARKMPPRFTSCSWGREAGTPAFLEGRAPGC